MGLRVKEALRLKECGYKERVRGAAQLLLYRRKLQQDRHTQTQRTKSGRSHAKITLVRMLSFNRIYLIFL